MCAAQTIDLSKKVKCNPSRSLDLSKENLLLQLGGKKSLLSGTPSKNEADTKKYRQLNKEKENLEWVLQSYNGDDPLKPRYDYITWIERNCESSFSNTKYIPLLEDTISLFKDDLRYKQDTRFIEIIIKYVELQHDQVDLYQTFFSQGLGTLCSLLYISWADALDRINDCNRANQVYETGIRYSAQPLEKLKRAQVNFQLNLGQRVLQSQIVSPRKANSACNRQILSKFQKPTQILSNTNIQGKSITLHNSDSESSNFVYQDNIDGNKATFYKKSETLNISSASDKVHTPSAETVNNNGCISSKLKVPKLSSATPKFHVHTDNSNEEEPSVLPVVSSVLKPVKGIDLSKICPLALFEPPDPKRKAMYPKEKVYSGGKELQLEELKARLYDKKYEESLQRSNTSQLITGYVSGENENSTNGSGNISLKTDSSLRKLSKFKTSITEHKCLVNNNENPSNLTFEKYEIGSKKPSQMLSVNYSVDGGKNNLMLFNSCDNLKNLSFKDNENNPLDVSQLQSGHNVMGVSKQYDLLKKNKNKLDLSSRNVKSDGSYPSIGFESEESSAYLNGSKLNHCQEQNFSVIEKQNINEIAPERDLLGKKEFGDIGDNIKHHLLMNVKDDKSFSLGSQSSLLKEKSDNGYQHQSDDTMDTFTSSQIHKPFQVSYEYTQNELSKYFNESCNEMMESYKKDKEIRSNSSYNSIHNESKRLIGWKPGSSLNKSKPIFVTETSVGISSSEEMEDKVQRIWESNSPVQAEKTEYGHYNSNNNKHVVSDDKMPDTRDSPSTSENGNDYNNMEIVCNSLNLGKKEDDESLPKTLQNPTVEKINKLESKMKNDDTSTYYGKFNIQSNKCEESLSESKHNNNFDSSQSKRTFENVTASSNIFSSISHLSNSKKVSNKCHDGQSVNKCYVSDISHENRDKILMESDPESLKGSNTVVKMKCIDKLQNDTNNIKNDFVNCKLKSIVTEMWSDSNSDSETEVKFKMTSQQKDSSSKFKITGQQKDSPNSICKYSRKDSNNPTMTISEEISKFNDNTKTSRVFNVELKLQQKEIDINAYPQNPTVKTSCALEGNNEKLIEDNVSDCMKWKNIVNNIWDDSDSEGEMRVKSKISSSNLKDNFFTSGGVTNKNSNHPIMFVNETPGFDYIDQPSTSNHYYFKLKEKTSRTELNEIHSKKINDEPYLMKEEIISQENNDRTKTISVNQDCSSNIKMEGNDMNVNNFINDIWSNSSSENEVSYDCMVPCKKQSDQNIVTNRLSFVNQYCKISDHFGKEKLNYSDVLLESNDQNYLLHTQRSFMDPKDQRTEYKKQIYPEPCQNISNINEQHGAAITNPVDIKKKYIFKDNIKIFGVEQLQDATGKDDSFSGYCREMNESFPMRNDSFNCSMENPLTGNDLGNNSDTKINFDVDKMFKEFEDNETTDIKDRQRYRFGIDDSF